MQTSTGGQSGMAAAAAAAAAAGGGSSSMSMSNTGRKGNSSSTNSSSKKAAAGKGANAAAANTGGGAGREGEEEKKKRSSRACDNCKRQKCRCVRLPDEQGEEATATGPCQNCKINGVECTFLGASKKRGPPKGYIEAIENRMHRMEALLGGLLNNDDPRAQALLEELVGDIEARELLSKDLAVAAAVGRDNAPTLKTWQRPGQAPGNSNNIPVKREESVAPSFFTTGGRSSSKAPITQRGFDLSSILGTPSGSNSSLGNASPFAGGDYTQLPPLQQQQQQQQQQQDSSFSFASRQDNWIPEEDVLDGVGVAGDGEGGQISPAFSNTGTGGFVAGGGSGGDGGMDFSNAAIAFGGVDANYSAGSLNAGSHPGSLLGPSSFSTSPRTNQRRRLEGSSGSTSAVPGIGGSNSNTSAALDSARSAQTLFSMQASRASSSKNRNNVGVPNTIGHTGSAYYSLSSGGTGNASVSGSVSRSRSRANDSTSPGALAAYTGGDSNTVYGGDDAKSPSADGMSPNAAISAVSGGSTSGQNQQQQQEGPMSELADVVGQLSLDENREVRYHGRSSGLYLISKSSRYQDFFWRFPKAGVWPPAEDESNMIKTELEIVKNTNANSVMPDKRTADHLLELYWIYVHPHLPLLYRSLFVRQYRNTVHGSDSSEGDAGTGGGEARPAMANGGKVPALLLLAVYATAARYSDTGGAKKEGVYWKAGEEYAKKAKDILFEDFGSSRLSTCQALLLLAYREIGCGAMAKSWTFVGMAVRMAQDLGLFRDVDKWFLPVNAFGYEEKQTRKRVWWACVVMDRYVSAYIGRPMAIYERDYDVALPAEDEPDEHDIWRPIRPDGTDWSSPTLASTTASSNSTSDDPDASLLAIRNFPQGVKSNSLSCFNHSATLSVMFSRIISNLYAIRVRVLGQNSETLLAHLDQALASWFLKLPPHLQYNSGSKKIPPPHVLVLHCQFFAALILLHRPFIPAHGSASLTETFPSHSICTTAAAAISNIVTLYSKTYGLRQAIPFLTYYVFSAGIMHVYNSTYDPSLAPTAKAHLHKCMRALQEMETIWPSASRQRELLLGLVDLRDVDIDIETTMAVGDHHQSRGRKREAENQEVDSKPGSRAATPAYSISEAYRRVGKAGTLQPQFASAGLGQQQQQQQQQQGSGAHPPPPVPRRTASMSLNRKRHNSVTTATLRQNSSGAGGSLASSNPQANVGAPNLSAQFPSSDFTFISPATQPIGLPGNLVPSPASTVTTGFDFSGMSPGNVFATSSGFSIPHVSSNQQGESSQFTASDGAHIHNILGLSGAMNIPYSPPSSGSGQMSQSMPDGSTTGFDLHFQQNQNQNQQQIGNAPSGTAFGNFTDLLTDPFWLSMQQDINAGERMAQNTDSNMAGQTHSPATFDEMQSTAFFGANFSNDAGATPDDWHKFLQTTPGDSTGNDGH